MKNFLGYGLSAVLAFGAAADTIGNVTPNVIFGSGNANGSFTIDQAEGVELALRGKLRHNGSGAPENTFNSNGFVGPNGISTYSFAAGVAPTQAFPTAVWSFEWSINSNFDGNGGVLDDYTYELGLDTDASQGVNFSVIFDPIHAFNPNPNVLAVQWDHAMGTNATGNGGGVSISNAVDDTALYNTRINTLNVAQNSWKPHWYMPGFDPTVDGTYNFYLAAYDTNGLVTRTDIQIIVGNGGAPVVPIPGAAGLGLAGMFLVGARRLKRKTA